MRLGLTLSDRGKQTRSVFSLKNVAGRLMPGVDLHSREKLFDLLDGW